MSAGEIMTEALRDDQFANETGASVVKKIRAAGDEADGWEARSEEEIREAGLWDAVHFASIEIDETDHAGIFEEGRDWTRAWYTLNLEQFIDAEIAMPIDEQTASKLLDLAKQNGRIEDLVNEVIASQFERGFELPQILRERLVKILRDYIPKKARPIEPEPKHWVRNYMINHVAGLLGTLYDLERTRGKEQAKSIAASDVIYHAMCSKPGKSLGFGTIQNIIFNPDITLGPLSSRNKMNFTDIETEIVISMFDDYDD